MPKALSGELILQALCEIAGRKRDIGLAQVEALYGLFFSQVGRKREFIYGLKAEREYEGVRLFQSSGVTEEGKAESKQDDKTDSKQEGLQDERKEIVQVIPDGEDFSLGGEYIVAQRYPIRFGFYTGFSSIRVPDDPDNTDMITADVDMYGITFSVGRRSENMSVNLGLDYAFGSGHDLTSDANGGKIRTDCDRTVALVTVSTTYYY
jgi:hypothetical protein